MRFITPRSAALVVSLAVLATVAAACGSKADDTTTPVPTTPGPQTVSPPPSTGPDEQMVAANWQKFFAGTTPAATKIKLLQDGQRFTTVINAQAGSALAKSIAATVTAVKLTSPTKASVTYSISLGGQTVLADQTGQAVKVNGVWQVGAKSFQALLKLEQQAGSAAPAPASTP